MRSRVSGLSDVDLAGCASGWADAFRDMDAADLEPSTDFLLVAEFMEEVAARLRDHQDVRAELAHERAMFAEAERLVSIICRHHWADEQGRKVVRWGAGLLASPNDCDTYREAVERSLARKTSGRTS